MDRSSTKTLQKIKGTRWELDRELIRVRHELYHIIILIGIHWKPDKNLIGTPTDIQLKSNGNSIGPALEPNIASHYVSQKNPAGMR